MTISWSYNVNDALKNFQNKPFSQFQKELPSFTLWKTGNSQEIDKYTNMPLTKKKLADIRSLSNLFGPTQVDNKLMQQYKQRNLQQIKNQSQRKTTTSISTQQQRQKINQNILRNVQQTTTHLPQNQKQKHIDCRSKKLLNNQMELKTAIARVLENSIANGNRKRQRRVISGIYYPNYDIDKVQEKIQQSLRNKNDIPFNRKIKALCRAIKLYFLKIKAKHENDDNLDDLVKGNNKATILAADYKINEFSPYQEFFQRFQTIRIGDDDLTDNIINLTKLWYNYKLCETFIVQTNFESGTINCDLVVEPTIGGPIDNSSGTKNLKFKKISEFSDFFKGDWGIRIVSLHGHDSVFGFLKVQDQNILYLFYVDQFVSNPGIFINQVNITAMQQPEIQRLLRQNWDKRSTINTLHIDLKRQRSNFCMFLAIENKYRLFSIFKELLKNPDGNTKADFERYSNDVTTKLKEIGKEVYGDIFL